MRANRFASVANSPRGLFITFAVVLTGASIAYAVFEGATILDGAYWAIVTATTLGYGDFSPHTAAGKVLTSVLIASTVFLFIPMITANIAAKLIVDRDAFTHEEQEQIKDALVRIESRMDAAEPEA